MGVRDCHPREICEPTGANLCILVQFDDIGWSKMWRKICFTPHCYKWRILASASLASKSTQGRCVACFELDENQALSKYTRRSFKWGAAYCESVIAGSRYWWFPRSKQIALMTSLFLVPFILFRFSFFSYSLLRFSVASVSRVLVLVPLILADVSISDRLLSTLWQQSAKPI